MTNEILVRRTVAIPGTRGPKGPSGEIVSATAKPLPHGSEPTVTLGGTPEKRTLEFGLPGGPQGEPGNGSVDSVNGDRGPDIVLTPEKVGAVGSVNGKPGPDPVLTAADVGALTQANADVRYVRPTVFSLEKARISFGAAFGFVDQFVMQGPVLSEADDNRWYIVRNTAGTVADRETTVISKIGASGSGLDVMTLLDAGHGDTIFVETDSAGKQFVWAYFIDWRKDASDAARHNYVRIPWSAGSYTYASVERYRVASISGIAWSANYDEFNGIVSFRRGGGTTRTMTAYRLEDIKSMATLPTPIASGTVTVSTAHGSLQNHAYMHETGNWFFLYGATSGPQALISYKTNGTVEHTRRIEQLVSIDAFGRQFAYYEPEGLFVHHTPDGTPSLIFGMSTGEPYARKSTVWSVDMGHKSPAFDMLTAGLAPDQSPWLKSKDLAVATLEAAFSESTGWPFALSISDDKVHMQGRLDGTITGGSVKLMTVAPTFRPAETRQTYCILQGTGGVCRLEISVSGAVTVYPPSGSFSWIDFSTAEYRLSSIK